MIFGNVVGSLSRAGGESKACEELEPIVEVRPRGSEVATFV